MENKINTWHQLVEVATTKGVDNSMDVKGTALVLDHKADQKQNSHVINVT